MRLQNLFFGLKTGHSHLNGILPCGCQHKGQKHQQPRAEGALKQNDPNVISCFVFSDFISEWHKVRGGLNEWTTSILTHALGIFGSESKARSSSAAAKCLIIVGRGRHGAFFGTTIVTTCRITYSFVIILYKRIIIVSTITKQTDHLYAAVFRKCMRIIEVEKYW